MQQKPRVDQVDGGQRWSIDTWLLSCQAKANTVCSHEQCVEEGYVWTKINREVVTDGGKVFASFKCKCMYK